MQGFLERLAGSIARVSATLQRITLNGAAWDTQALTQTSQSITAAAAVPIDVASGLYVIVAQTTNVAHLLGAPTNGVTGQVMTIEFRNTSGGAAGATTFNAVYKIQGGAWTNAATANNRKLVLYFNGTNWTEVSRNSADVPN